MNSGEFSELGKDADTPTARVTFLHGQSPPTETERLPRGQHDLSPEFVAQHQRSRILEATTRVLGERGYGPTTIADIVALAHVSRRSFYDHFDSKDHCVVAAFGAATTCVADAVRGAYGAEDDWGPAVAAALTELMRLWRDHPHVARTCFSEAGAVGALGEERVASGMSMCEDALRQAIADRPDGAPVSDLTVQLAVGGLVSLIRSRVAEGRSESLLADLPEITTALLTPVVGATATASVVEQIAAPAAGGASEQAI